MAVTITHATAATGVDSGDGLISKDEWNEDHAVVGFGSGTTFPGSPVSGDLFFRTDLGLQFYYDGARWVTTTIFESQVYQVYTATAPSTALRATSGIAGSEIYVVDVTGAWHLDGGTSNASNRWNIQFIRQDGGSSSVMETITTDVGAASVFVQHTIAVGTAHAGMDGFAFNITKTGSPGNIQGGFKVRYRIVGT